MLFSIRSAFVSSPSKKAGSRTGGACLLDPLTPSSIIVIAAAAVLLLTLTFSSSPAVLANSYHEVLQQRLAFETAVFRKFNALDCVLAGCIYVNEEYERWFMCENLSAHQKWNTGLEDELIPELQREMDDFEKEARTFYEAFEDALKRVPGRKPGTSEQGKEEVEERIYGLFNQLALHHLSGRETLERVLFEPCVRPMPLEDEGQLSAAKTWLYELDSVFIMGNRLKILYKHMLGMLSQQNREHHTLTVGGLPKKKYQELFLQVLHSGNVNFRSITARAEHPRTPSPLELPPPELRSVKGNSNNRQNNDDDHHLTPSQSLDEYRRLIGERVAQMKSLFLVDQAGRGGQIHNPRHLLMCAVASCIVLPAGGGGDGGALQRPNFQLQNTPIDVVAKCPWNRGLSPAMLHEIGQGAAETARAMLAPLAEAFLTTARRRLTKAKEAQATVDHLHTIFNYFALRHLAGVRALAALLLTEIPLLPVGDPKLAADIEVLGGGGGGGGGDAEGVGVEKQKEEMVDDVKMEDVGGSVPEIKMEEGSGEEIKMEDIGEMSGEGGGSPQRHSPTPQQQRVRDEVPWLSELNQMLIIQYRLAVAHVHLKKMMLALHYEAVPEEVDGVKKKAYHDLFLELLQDRRFDKLKEVP